MMLRRWTVLLGIGLLVCAQGIEASQVVRRFVLAAGANFGGEKRTPLRYAVSDAEHFARVLEMMGGVESEDQFLLAEPSLENFKRVLADLETRIIKASQSSSRIEVVLYYSGHADENGLLLGEDRLTYRALRDAMNSVRADVHITVLDACASGAITRLKGGQRQKAFMVDTSSDMRGYAFLTSSSENEAAQESDRIRGSFFTHYLVSGLRGAADVTGDGKVTLSEAYAFAFRNTLKRTEKTQGGAQHPAYDIKMTGTGDVVMTDVRETSASLILSDELNGRFFVRNSQE
ncbi:MAG: caspase family protein, partial [Candidatus Latescibacteria bacterium]|nr:caspase family protein [Candidatus Latescibacterota bacterium]